MPNWPASAGSVQSFASSFSGGGLGAGMSRSASFDASSALTIDALKVSRRGAGCHPSAFSVSADGYVGLRAQGLTRNGRTPPELR
jgi:hypothetical protein